MGATTLALAITLQTANLPAQAQHPVPVTGHVIDAASAEQSGQLIFSRVSSGLSALDNTPLKDRTPLVLIHGIGGTESRLFHWENFLEFARQQKSFNQQYKIYLYHYDSTRSVPTISRDLQKTLKGFISGLDGRNIKILAYSEGGLLTRNAMQDPYLNDHTDTVLTIATPFHGSPLANPEWMQAQAKTESPVNIVRMTQKVAYAITGRKYPTFRQDFHWDNFDNAIPMDQYVKNNGPVSQTDYSLARKKNFITYGSYFGKEVDSSALAKQLELKKTPPEEKLVFGNVFKKNFLFSLVRNNIGKLPLAHKAQSPSEIVLQTQANIASSGVTAEAASKEVVALAGVKTDEILLDNPQPSVTLQLASERPTPELPGRKSVLSEVKALPTQTLPPSVSMMMYNDGISPISSTLWLGRYTPKFDGVSQPVDKLWATLKSLKGNRSTRLFAGLDHRNWMDGVTRTGNDQIEDLLNPDEQPRSVFEWILHDLMG